MTTPEAPAVESGSSPVSGEGKLRFEAAHTDRFMTKLAVIRIRTAPTEAWSTVVAFEALSGPDILQQHRSPHRVLEFPGGRVGLRTSERVSRNQNFLLARST